MFLKRLSANLDSSNYGRAKSILRDPQAPDYFTKVQESIDATGACGHSERTGYKPKKR